MQNWRATAGSDDLTKLAAVASLPTRPNSGSIWYSVDSGASWVESSETTSKRWSCIASSSTFDHLVAGDYHGSLYLGAYNAVDGLSWTEVVSPGSPGAQYWEAVASSADGTTIMGFPSYGRIWRSTDTGATWSEIGPPGDRYWYAADMSSDGMTVVAAVWRENLWATTDGGLTWSDITPSNVPYRGWHAIACSLDCSAVRVAVYSGNLWSGYLSSAGG